MACFLAPAAAAIVTTVAQKVAEKKGKTAGGEHIERTRGPWAQRLRWLNVMLWGSTALLALEHVWQGELVPWPPFLTALEAPSQVGPMLHEIVTLGAFMTGAVVVAWGILVAVAELKARARNLPEAGPKVVDGES